MGGQAERTGGEVLAKALSLHGVDTVFGIPGTHNLAIYAAMSENNITNVTVRHEQGAGYAADGFARSTGREGVVITTTGPAALNAATALGQSYSDSVPVLLIAPGMPTGHPSFGNGLLHELRDQRLALSGVVAESHRVESIAEIPVAVAQAFARMRSGRPRAEYLEIPLDLLDEKAAVFDVAPLALPEPQKPTDAEVMHAARFLEKGQKRLIIAGGGAANASTQLQHVAEKLGAPVVTSTNGKGVIPENHDLSLGAGLHHESVYRAAAEADVILAVGTELAPSDWWLGLPEINKKLVRIDVDESAIFVNAVPAVALIGDAQTVLQLLADSLTQTTENVMFGDLKTEVLKDKEKMALPWLEAVRSVADILPAGAVVAADNSMVSYYAALGILNLDRPRSFLFPTGAGTLGYGLPAGWGAKIANSKTPVVVFQGDGGLMFTIQELQSASVIGGALPVIVFDNGGYGEIRNQMAERGDPEHAVALGSPDFVKLAEAMGCLGVKVEQQKKLGEAVLNALEADRPTLIHIIENSEAARVLRG